MTVIDGLVQQPAAQAVARALVQFVWQGTLIGVVTAVVLGALRRSAADVRYVVSTIALSLMLTMPAVTVWQGLQAAVEDPLAASVAGVAVAAESSNPAATVEHALPLLAPAGPSAPGIPADADVRRAWSVSQYAPWLLGFWLAGVAVLTLRLFSGWLWVQRMKSHGAVAIDAAVEAVASRLARRLHIRRRIRLVESPAVDVPTVIGFLKPVVLLPASALAGLSPQQLEAILAHELAHIRRHDYLVNLLQTVVETLLFYHPAIWWLSRRIRIEREHCCDDLAVSLCGDPIAYAQALADLEEQRGSGGRLALAASGGSLLLRVRRLLGAPSHAGPGPGWLAATIAITVMTGIAIGALGREASGEQPASSEMTREGTDVLLQDVPPRPPRPPSPPPAPPLPPEAPAGEIPARPVDDLPPVPPAPAAPPAPPALPVVGVPAPPPPAPPALPAFGLPVPPAPAPPAVSAPGLRAPAPPAPPPVPMEPMSQSVTRQTDRGRQSGTFTWSNDGERLEVKYRGEIAFTDDDTDVRSLTPGGSLRIKDGGFLGGHTVEFTADSSGAITRRFWAGTSERPFEPEGRKWLAQVLPRFIRQTGIGAEGRVARILKAKGVPGVLAEISLITGSWAKRLYFTELLRTPLDSKTAQQVLAQAGREVDSDFELASLLISADRLLTDDATRGAYFEAARTIASDFEMRRVFSAALKKGAVSPALLAAMLQTSTSIASDFELASLLVEVVKGHALDGTTRGAFFTALGSVESDFERRRVLSAVMARPGAQPAETVAAVLESALGVDSDFESASLLVQVAKEQPIEGALRAPFFKAAAGIGSAHERGRVLRAVATRTDASDETILAVIQSARSMNGQFEIAQILLAVASARPLSREARDAYIDAADRLGEFEQGRVLSALVRNERRR